MLMRIKLITPQLDILSSFGGVGLYNALMTTHGITMLFLFGTPMISPMRMGSGRDAVVTALSTSLTSLEKRKRR